ncbi:MAG: tetratricopeptide repeat-containing glycosyltransferase family 2 protein [Symbiobacteriia bacterium]
MQDRCRLSLCLIVRDEADTLQRCLTSAAPVVDEVVVIDTGSTDDTVDIARRLGARVEEVPWQQDFSRARNAGLGLARGDWIMCLDADEELELPEGEPERLRGLLDAATCEAFTLQIASLLDDGQQMKHEAVRLWRNRPAHRFEGSVHEQILPSILRADPQARVEPTGLRILHHGYDRKTRDQAAKARRNLSILRTAAQENRDDLFARYNLGVSHLQLSQHREASAVLAEVHARMKGTEPWAPSLIRNYALALEGKGDFDQALAVLEEGIDLWSDYTELHYLQGFLLLRKHLYGEALAAWKRCTLLGEPPARYMSTEGVGSYLAYEQIGLLQMRLQEHAEAIAAFAAALQANGDYSRPLYHLAKALSKMGQSPDQVSQYLETHFHFATIQSGLLFADVLAEAGAVEQALRQLERVLAQTEATDVTHHLRGRLLLRLARYQEALTEFERIPAASAQFLPGQRLICLCHWLQDPPAPADEALRRLEQGEEKDASVLAEYQRLLLTGSQSSPGDGDLPPGLVVTACLNLAEDFLRLGAPHRADLAASMIGSCAPERASLHLGKLFYRWGQTDSAAHWLLNGLKEGNYDPDSLRILAEVTLERDLFEEAEQLASEALALEPDNLQNHLGVASIYLKQAKRILGRGQTFVPGATLLKEELRRVEECMRWL